VSRERRRALCTLVVLTVLVGGVYAGAIHAPFIFDDGVTIVDNPSIRRLWPPIGSSEAPGPFSPPPLAATARRPLPNLTFALNYRLGKLDPAGYHLVNLLLHVLAAATLASIVRRTLRFPYFGMADDVAWPLSLAVALVWALHPLGSEAVVYVTQRTEILGALCYLGMLWAALRYWSAGSRAGRRGWACVAGLASLCGMASKEVTVSAPLVVWLYERTFLGGSPLAARRSWTLYACLASGWIVLVVLSASGIPGLSDDRHQVPVLVWWATQTKVLFLYLALALWPWPLSIHYAPAYLRTIDAAWPWTAGAIVLLGVALAAVRRRPAARFVVIVTMLTLLPTLVVPLPKMVAAERRMYLPLAGLVALAVVAGYRLLAARRPSTAVRVTAGATATAIVVLSALTVRRVGAYETAVTIWRDAVLHQPDDAMSHYNLGVALLDAKRPADAIRSFEATLRLEPYHTKALDNLGATLDGLGRAEEAIVPLEEALRLDPDDEVAHNDLGAALLRLGRAPDAVVHLDRALALMGDHPTPIACLNLGAALAATGHPDEAIARFEQAVRLAPDDRDARITLANALQQAGRADEAVAHYERALAITPDDGTTQSNLGAALLRLGRTADGIAHLEQAVRLNPDHADAHYNLGRGLLTAGRPREAAEHFERAIRLDPTDAEARLQCALAYARSARPADAVAMARDGLAVARTHGQAAVADEIDAWLASEGGRAPGDASSTR
jgi:tetratricopeptide (TPR) repeat protein